MFIEPISIITQFYLQDSGVTRGGAEEAAALPEILKKLKNYFNNLYEKRYKK